MAAKTLNFTDLLICHGYEPNEVRLARHTFEKNKMFLAWRDNRGEYDTYCRIQRPKNFGNQKYVAHFVSTQNSETLFTGFFLLGQKKEIKASFVEPITEIDIYKLNPRPIIYDVIRVLDFEQYEGRLLIDWGPSKINWNQIASRKKSKPICEFRKKIYEDDFPGFLKFSCLSKNVSTLPESWKSILRANRGIYLLLHTDAETGQQNYYVGSATGSDSFLGRWLTYEKDGHGGNKKLRKLANKVYQISILEVSSSADKRDDIQNREQAWIEKLGSRAYGLNN